MNAIIRVNYDNDDLWCIYSKSRIEIGEKYIIVLEEDISGEYEKIYKLEYAPEDNSEEPYILESDE